FPALKQVLLAGWILRFAEGLSRRANSVNPLGPACADSVAVIAAAESLYRGQGQPAIFRVPTIVDPALDQTLATQRYTAEGESCVLYGAPEGLAAQAGPAVRLLASPKP